MTYTLRINVIRMFHEETDGASKMGHVWVVLSDGENEYSFGMYPADPGNLIKMWDGPGVIQTDDMDHNPFGTPYQPDWSAVIAINQTQFDTAMAYAKAIQMDPPSYWGLNSLYERSGSANCVTFAENILIRAGIVSSSGTFALTAWPADIPCAFSGALEGSKVQYNQTCTSVFDLVYPDVPVITCCDPVTSADLPFPVMPRSNHQLRYDTPIVYTRPGITTTAFLNAVFSAKIRNNGVPAALQVVLPMGIPPLTSASKLRGSTIDNPPTNLLMNAETIAELKAQGFIQDLNQQSVFTRPAVGELAFEEAIQALHQVKISQSDLIDNAACDVQVQMLTTDGTQFGTDLPLITYCQDREHTYSLTINIKKARHENIHGVMEDWSQTWVDISDGNETYSYSLYVDNSTDPWAFYGPGVVRRNETLLNPPGTAAEPEYHFTMPLTQGQFNATKAYADDSVTNPPQFYWYAPVQPADSDPYAKNLPLFYGESPTTYALKILSQAGINILPTCLNSIQAPPQYSFFYSKDPLLLACDLQNSLSSLGEQNCSMSISGKPYGTMIIPCCIPQDPSAPSMPTIRYFDGNFGVNTIVADYFTSKASSYRICPSLDSYCDAWYPPVCSETSNNDPIPTCLCDLCDNSDNDPGIFGCIRGADVRAHFNSLTGLVSVIFPPLPDSSSNPMDNPRTAYQALNSGYEFQKISPGVYQATTPGGYPSFVVDAPESFREGRFYCELTMPSGEIWRSSLPTAVFSLPDPFCPSVASFPLDVNQTETNTEESSAKTDSKSVNQALIFQTLAFESSFSFLRGFATNFSQSLTSQSLAQRKFSHPVIKLSAEVVHFLVSWGVFNLQAALFNLGISAAKLSFIYLGANQLLVNYSCQALSLVLSLYSIGSMVSLALFVVSFASSMLGAQAGTYSGNKLATVIFRQQPKIGAEQEKLLGKDKVLNISSLFYKPNDYQASPTKTKTITLQKS